MSDPIPLRDGAPGSLMAAIEIWRLPDGSATARLTYMAPWVIEAHDDVPQRMNMLAALLPSVADSLREQGQSCRHAGEPQ